jgi:arylformamidase
MFKDLSVPLNEKTPVYPGDAETQIEPAAILEKDGYQDHLVSLGTHVGTHMDAPAHMIPKGKTLDQYPVERFVGRGVVIRVGGQFSLDDVKNADLRQGDIVLFNTGFDNKYHDPEYFATYPAIPEDIAHYLVEKKVSIVGIDMCSPDHEPFPTHKILLGGDVLIVENLTGLEELHGDIEVTALPIKLQLDGSPARVIAKLSED